MTKTGTNPAVDLARYELSTGPRVVGGQRIDGRVRVTDHPAAGRGRRYVIERELESKAELDALVTDYVVQAERWDAVPVSPAWLIPEEVL